MLTVGSSMHDVTILVADVREYTRIAESISVDSLALLMAKLFRECTRAVEKQAGVVDKFIGDAVMARWVAEERRVAGTALSALKAAHEIWRAVEEIGRQASGLPCPLRVGVGINTGRAVLGNIGAGMPSDYTAVGDAVNVAFRLEAASKELEADVVLGSDSFRHLPNALWQKHLRSVSVKGKREMLTVCAFRFAELDAIVAEMWPPTGVHRAVGAE
jgi:adenylate cyclase